MDLLPVEEIIEAGTTEAVVSRLVDFFKGKLHSLVKTSDMVDVQLEKLKQLYSLRHNLFHALMSVWLHEELTLDTETQIGVWCEDKLGIRLPDQLAKLTPDIMLYRNVKGQEIFMLLDVSLTQRPNEIRDNKRRKYDPIVEFVHSISPHRFDPMISKFYPLCVKPTLDGLGTYLAVLANLLDLDMLDFPSRELLSFIHESEEVGCELESMINDTNAVKAVKENAYSSHIPLQDMVLELPAFQHKCLVSEFVQPDFDHVKNLVFDLSTDDKLMDRFEDKPVTPGVLDAAKNDIEKVIRKCKTVKHPRPSHHMFITPVPDNWDTIMSSAFPTPEFHVPTEQLQIVRLLHLIKAASEEIEPFEHEISTAMLKSLINGDSYYNFSIFSTGSPDIRGKAGSLDTEANLRADYHKERDNNKINPPSYLNWWRKRHALQPLEPWEAAVVRQKMIKVPLSTFKSGRHTWEKAHVQQKSSESLKPGITLDRPQETVGLQYGHDSVAAFIKLLSSTSTQLPLVSGLMEEFLTQEPGPDCKAFYSAKEESIKGIKSILPWITETSAYRYNKAVSLLYEQLLHFQQYSVPANQFSIFTSGIPNQCVLVAGGYVDKGKDVGKAYKIIGFTDQSEWLSPVFGNLKIHVTHVSNKKLYFYTSNWYRLTIDKISHLRDQFYGTLSTAFASICRQPQIQGDGLSPNDKDNLIEWAYTARSFVALCPNQRNAEIVSDVRYFLMHCVSDYSELKEFIVDKFKPPYTNCIEAWVVSKALNAHKLIKDAHQPGSYFIRQPIFSKSTQQIVSTGGKFKLPSFWANWNLTDIQDFMDDLFCYVHTPKEPASIHHESIKSINTILKFQGLFDSLSDSEKQGIWAHDRLKSCLIEPQISVGFHHITVATAGHLMSQKLKNKVRKEDFIKVLNEPVCNITSTKSVIPDGARCVTEDVYDEKQLEKFSRKTGLQPSRTKRYKLETRGTILPTSSGTQRMKVHDAILDIFMKHEALPRTILDLAMAYITDAEYEVAADICIKAQYGGKREFYVIGIVAKALMRLSENIYKVLGQATTEEMISVPGDRKLLHMQDKLATAIMKRKPGDFLYAVNGDCSKWSAAETLECFTVFNHSMNALFGENVETFLNHVSYLWANKKIYIPSSILTHTLNTDAEKTSYLKDDAVMSIKSTQNFLQGMMNYESSLKSVAVTNLSIAVFKSLHPESDLRVDHLEHSDDYIQIATGRTKEDFLQFRRYHKIIMRLCGINDSYKKTNIQKIFMEFISLVNFNGHLAYPHIKKLKECGLNIACTGYKDDIKSALSRASEAVRVGVPLMSAYFMQRVHLLNIVRAYSLLPNMSNFVWPMKAMFTIPVEAFGVPDTLPLVGTVSKGDGNTVRLWRHGTKESRDYIIGLFNLAYINTEKPDQLDIQTYDTPMQLYHPSYIFDKDSKRIKALQESLPGSKESYLQFWEDHPCYNFIKPIEPQTLKTWMEAMYYKSNFTLAYSRIGRASLTMRLSRYIHAKCLYMSEPITSELAVPDTVSIREFKLRLDKYIHESRMSITPEHEIIFLRTVYSSDPTQELIYNTFSKAGLVPTDGKCDSWSTRLLPNPPKWLSLDNPGQTIFQYIFDPDMLMKDKRFSKGVLSLEADKKALEDIVGVTLGPKSHPMLIKMVYNDIMQSKQMPNMAAYPGEKADNIETYLLNYLESGLMPNMRYMVIRPGISKAMNPYTQTIYYKRHNKLQPRMYRSLTNDLVLLASLYMYTAGKSANWQKILQEIVPKLTYKDPHEGSTPLDDINKLSYLDIVNSGCMPYEKKCFCFLKWVYCNDIKPLYQYLEEESSYQYQYYTSQTLLNTDIAAESVYVRYLGQDFNCYYYKKQVYILAKRPNLLYLKNVYLIAQKLFNLITENKFHEQYYSYTYKQIDLINKETLRDFFNILQIQGECIDQCRPDFTIEQGPLDYPFGIVPNLKHTNDTQAGHIKASIILDEKNSTVYIGKMKFFTVPFLACQQYNSLQSNTELPSICNLRGNWWLEHGRMYASLRQDMLINTSEMDDNWVNLEQKVLLEPLCKQQMSDLYMPEINVQEEDTEFNAPHQNSENSVNLPDISEFVFDNDLEFDMDFSSDEDDSDFIPDNIDMDTQSLIPLAQNIIPIQSSYSTDIPRSIQTYPTENTLYSRLANAYIRDRNGGKLEIPITTYISCLRLQHTLLRYYNQHRDMSQNLLGAYNLLQFSISNIFTAPNVTSPGILGAYTVTREGNKLQVFNAFKYSRNKHQLFRQKNVYVQTHFIAGLGYQVLSAPLLPSHIKQQQEFLSNVDDAMLSCSLFPSITNALQEFVSETEDLQTIENLY